MKSVVSKPKIMYVNNIQRRKSLSGLGTETETSTLNTSILKSASHIIKASVVSG